MNRRFKTKPDNRFTTLLRDNKGASIVLVTIIAILIITGVIILRTTTSALWASADKQLNQDQAYEMATSMGNSLDGIIVGNKSLDLSSIAAGDGVIISKTSINGLPNATISASVEPLSKDDNNRVYIVTVEANVATASYSYIAQYSGSGTNYRRLY
ncbi:MAG: hypothetical protein Q4C15_11575 [Eubacteriales bacterium]|nr:hypothetical protein [Eubacteriales bacterium]